FPFSERDQIAAVTPARACCTGTRAISAADLPARLSGGRHSASVFQDEHERLAVLAPANKATVVRAGHRFDELLVVKPRQSLQAFDEAKVGQRWRDSNGPSIRGGENKEHVLDERSLVGCHDAHLC